MGKLATVAYRAIFKRSGTMVALAVIGGVFLERTIDVIGENIFFSINKGVSIFVGFPVKTTSSSTMFIDLTSFILFAEIVGRYQR